MNKQEPIHITYSLTIEEVKKIIEKHIGIKLTDFTLWGDNIQNELDKDLDLLLKNFLDENTNEEIM